VQRCDRRVADPVRYRPTALGVAAPSLRLAVRPRKGRFALEHGFQVDTGSDIAMGVAAPLRDWLRSSGARAKREAVEWGPAVKCEVYEVEVLVERGWMPFDAYFPLRPTLDENLVGLPLLQHIPLCLRPDDGLLCMSRRA